MDMVPPTLSSRISASPSRESDDGRIQQKVHNRSHSNRPPALDKRYAGSYDDDELEVDCYGAKKGPNTNTNQLLKIWIFLIVVIAIVITLLVTSSYLEGWRGLGSGKSKLSYVPDDCLDDRCSIEDLWSWASSKGIVANRVQIASFPCPQCGRTSIPFRFHGPAHSL